MSESKPSLLNKLEIGLIMVFFTGFIFWAVSKCSSTREELARQRAVETEDLQSARPALPPSVDRDSLMPLEETAGTEGLERITPLYVTIDGLNMRDLPGLNSQVIMKLDLFEEVYYLDEVTSYRDSIRINEHTYYEPWVKVKHQRGREGWVYGAGVHFYRMRR